MKITDTGRTISRSGASPLGIGSLASCISVGSIASIASVGSIACLGSVGSIGSIGSVGSIASVGKVGAIFNIPVSEKILVALISRLCSRGYEHTGAQVHAGPSARVRKCE